MREPHTSRHLPSSGHIPDPVTTDTATPVWINTSARPLESAISAHGQQHIGAAATLWPVGQQRDGLRRAGRYVPGTRRHPQRTGAALTAHIIDRYSQPGQVVFDPFVGSGTTMVEAAYAGRHSVGVDIDVRWHNLTADNIALAYRHGATVKTWLEYADARYLDRPPRRLRHRVDLVLATPPTRLAPADIGSARDDAEIVANLELDMAMAMQSWLPLLRPGATVVITTRLLSRPDYLLDLSVPIAAAADLAGLRLVERAAALRTPLREPTTRRAAHRTGARHRRRVRVVHDDVLIYQVPSAPAWWRTR